MKDMRFFLITLMLALGGCAAYGEEELRLWYTRPAAGWLEALPIGNSHLGGMVYGGTETEEICLNEETFWSGRPYENNSRESLAALPEVRRLIFEGKEQEAARLIGQHIIKGPHGMRYLPLGSVRLSLGHRDVSRYERDLDLTNATASTSYIYNNVRYERMTFASLADDVIVCHMKAGRRGALSVGIDFASQLPAEVVSTAEADGDGQPCMLSATVAGVAQEGIEAGLKANCSLRGKGLRVASGDCPNELFAPADIRQPLRSPELQDLQALPLRKVYEYDIQTEPGRTYRFARNKDAPR